MNEKKTIILITSEEKKIEQEIAILEKYGYAVRTADYEAFSDDVSSEADLIITYLGLDNYEHGIRKAAEIASKYSFPLLFLSSSTEKQVMEQAEKISPYGYVLKDSGEIPLVSAVKMALKLHEASEKIEQLADDSAQTGKEIPPKILLKSLMLDQIKDCITITDLEGKITYINQAESDMLGFSEQDILGKKTNVYGEDQLKGATQQEILEKTLEGGSWRGEVVNLDKEGNKHTMDCRTMTIKDSSGNPVALCGISTDITEQKRLETALRESEIKYAFLAQTALELVDFYSLQTTYEYTARKLYDLLEGNCIVAIAEYKTDKNRWKIKHFEGIRSNISKLSKILGFDLMKMEGDISTKYYDKISSGRLVEIDFDLPAFFNNKVSAKISEVMKKMLSIDKLYCISFQQNDKLYGNITIITNRKTKPLNVELIETYVRQVTNFVKKQQAEEALKESEALLANAEKIAHVGSWVFDTKTKQMTWSDEGYRIFGFNPQEIHPNYDDFIQTIHPDDREKVEKAYLSCLQKEEAGYELEHRIVRKDTGEVRFVLAKCVHERDVKGFVVRSIGMIQDITELAQTKRELEENSQLQRLMTSFATKFVNTSVDQIENTIGVMFQHIGVYGLYDRVYLFEHDFDRQTTTNTYEWCAEGVTPAINQLKDVPFDVAAGFLTELQKGELMIIPNVASLPDEAPVKEILQNQGVKSLVAVPLMKDDLNIGFIGFDSVYETRTYKEIEINLLKILAELATNILDKKQTERELIESINRFEKLSETSRSFYWSIDMQGNYTNVSNAVESVLGYKPDEMLGKKVWDYHPQEGREEFKMLCVNKLNNSLTDLNFENRMVTRKGKIIWVSTTTTLHYNAQQIMIGMQGVDTDISERKKGEEEQENLRQQLVHSQKIEAVGRLAAGVAHDFNNTLSVVLGYAELVLLRLNDNHPVYKSIMEIHKAAERSSKLTQQLLAFARREPVSTKVINLNDTIDTMIEMLRKLIGTNISLKWQPAKELWPIEIDPNQVDQILVNLCVNARDAIDGKGKVTIETSNVININQIFQREDKTEGKEYVLLTVSDNGCGMDEETLEKLFEPFFTTKSQGKGTGLGLPTIHGIVKQNNGFIDVESDLGEGTTFYIYLPRTDLAFQTDTEDDNQHDFSLEEEVTILIVDDDESIPEMLKPMLEMMGYNVLTAYKPIDAIEIFKQNSDTISLLVSDVMMPEMNGVELANRLHEIKPDLKILFTSGYTADIITQDRIGNGTINFISKPFKMKSLQIKIAEVLGYDLQSENLIK